MNSLPATILVGYVLLLSTLLSLPPAHAAAVATINYTPFGISLSGPFSNITCAPITKPRFIFQNYVNNTCVADSYGDSWIFTWELDTSRQPPVNVITSIAKFSEVGCNVSNAASSSTGPTDSGLCETMNDPSNNIEVQVAVITTDSYQPRRVSGTCRGLAMSGGGDKAAYEAGVLSGFVQYLPEEEYQYDVVTGISAGSTLTAAFSVFAVGQEQQAIQLALDIIADLNQSSIFQEWPGGVIEGFFKHNSLFDSSPLRTLIETIMEGRTLSPDRVTCMGASNLRTGLFNRFCDHQVLEDVVNATIASAAIPGVFKNQQIGTDIYIDGGTLVNVDVIGAVEQCLALGYDQTDIVIDVIECSGSSMPLLPGDLSQLTVLPILLRAKAMDDFSSSESDYEAAVAAYPNVNFRYRVFPSQDIPGSGIDFNRTEMLWMEQLGINDARNAINPSLLQAQ